MQRRFLTLVFVFLTAAATAQQSRPSVTLHGLSSIDVSASQKILLSNFCRLDFEGARLQAAGWNRLKPFTSLRSNPEFERIVVVTRFDVETAEHPSENVRVSYKAVGYYNESEGYTAVSANDHVVFRIQEQHGELMVMEITPSAPHVSPRAAVEWMNLRLNDPNTAEPERPHLRDAIAQLSKLVPQPRATNAAQ